MSNRIHELLAIFALDADPSAISRKFWQKYEVSDDEKKLFYEILSVIVKGYCFADDETQSIVELTGDSYREMETSPFVPVVAKILDERDLVKQCSEIT